MPDYAVFSDAVSSENIDAFLSLLTKHKTEIEELSQEVRVLLQLRNKHADKLKAKYFSEEEDTGWAFEISTEQEIDSGYSEAFLLLMI